MHFRKLTAIAALLCFAVPVFAQHKRPPITSSANMERIRPKNGLSSMDRRFMMDAAVINVAEVKLGELAQRRGGSWAKGFGRDMVREHTMAQKELRTLARSKRVSIPEDLDAKHRALYNKLSRLSGAAFDSMYRAEMIKGHTAALKKMQDEMRKGNDSMVRGYAVKMEPAVTMHLRMAQDKKTMLGH